MRAVVVSSAAGVFVDGAEASILSAAAVGSAADDDDVDECGLSSSCNTTAFSSLRSSGRRCSLPQPHLSKSASIYCLFCKCPHSSSDCNHSLLSKCHKFSISRSVVTLRSKLLSMAIVRDGELGQATAIGSSSCNREVSGERCPTYTLPHLSHNDDLPP